jgi:hypothetical protein
MAAVHVAEAEGVATGRQHSSQLRAQKIVLAECCTLVSLFHCGLYFSYSSCHCCSCLDSSYGFTDRTSLSMSVGVATR